MVGFTKVLPAPVIVIVSTWLDELELRQPDNTASASSTVTMGSRVRDMKPSCITSLQPS
jgi:hypothetical protein